MRLARWQRWLLVIIALGGVLWVYDRSRNWNEDSQNDVILEAANHYDVEPALVKAVVWRESKFDPNAVGTKGEIGLMQIMPDTARDWAKADKRILVVRAELFDRRKNTLCGAWYLRRLLGRYGNTDNRLPYALADYNAGRGNVLKWMQGPAATNSVAFIEAIGFPSTKEYVRTTMARYEKYRRSFPPKKS